MTQAAPTPREVTLADLLGDGVFTDGDWVESKDQDPDGDVRLIQLADVGEGVFRNRSSRFLTLAKAKELRCTFLEPGDVLVARMPEPLGRACIFPGVGQPAVTVVDVCVVRPRPDQARPEWLVKAINAPDVRSAMQRFVRGTTRQRISRKNLGSLPLRVPDIDAQTAVAALVDQLEVSRLSASTHIQAAERAVHGFRQATLVAACSGRLTADWRQANAPAEGAEELIDQSRVLVAAASSKQSRPESWTTPDWLEIPDSWAWAPLRGLGVVKGGIQKQPKRAPVRNAFPYMRVANVRRGAVDVSEMHQFELFKGELETYRLEPGDLLVVEGNGSASEIGRAALWRGEISDCVHQNHIIRVRSVGLEPGFLELFWNSPIAAREISALAVTSSGLYSLSTKKIGAVPIPVPPADEQREIIRRATELLGLAEGLRIRIDHARHAVEQTSRAVLTRAFRGELASGGV